MEGKLVKLQVKFRFCLTPKEVESLLGIQNLRDRGLMIMGLFCGFRISENVNFQWHWVNFEEGYIQVSENIKPKRFKPKYDSIRKIYPQGSVFEFLKFYQKNVTTRNYIFPSNRVDTQYRLTSIAAITLINKYAKQFEKTPETPHFGKAIGSHALRRTYASTLFNKLIADGKSYDETLFIIQNNLGHRDIETTRRYLFATQEEDNVKSVASLNLYDVDITKKNVQERKTDG